MKETEYFSYINNSHSFSFLKDLFLDQFQVHNKIEQKVQRVPIYSLSPHTNRLPHYQRLSLKCYICCNW